MNEKGLLEELIFANIINDFDDVKKLYNDGEAPKAFKLFKQRLREIKKYTRPSDAPDFSSMKMEEV